MKIKIAYKDEQRIIDSPEGVDFVGFSVNHKSSQYNAFNSFKDCPYKQDEEIVFDENFKIILHYYSSATLNEFLQFFAGYEGMAFIEIENNDFQMSVFT